MRIMPTVSLPLRSGVQWVPDPEGNANSHDGRTIRRDMRARDDKQTIAIAKRPRPEFLAAEMYSIGMERVCFTLASMLGLPVPETWLETVDGHPSSVQRRIPHARSWLQLQALMKSNIENADLMPLAALFDVWTANLDRRNVNLLFEPVPSGATPGKAHGSRMWLIDHGQCGLWPAVKFDLARRPEEFPKVSEVSATLEPRAEAVIGALMPPEYRMALKNTQGDARQSLLDRIHHIKDDALQNAVTEVPEEYIAADRADATLAFLKARRDALDRVASQYW